ncbi:MAG: AAA domain-containing protein, partial [Nannocystaceae bacterium]
MGVFYRANEHRQELELRPVDDDDLVPPDKGYLFGALQGDRTRLSRREEAVKRMRSADARIPQLALILEGQPAPKRRTDAVKALSAGARQVFKFGETPAQRRAIDQALNTPDIALIQGPPGTGKTTVIAALQVRLAEIEAEDPALGGRSLLTSYQHGAVNNAVERTTVFGLPPARIGGRRRSRAASDQADRWAVKACEKIQDTLDQRIEDRPRADYHRFRDRIALYASGNASGPEARALIEDFLALEAGVLPTTVWNSLLKLQSPPRCEKPELSLKEELTLERVHELPYDAASFQDGGPRKVRRALRQLRSLDPSLEPEQQALLERASKARPDDTFPELEALAALRTSLLARIMPASPNEPSDRSVQTKAFNAALAALYTRMLGAEGSIADALAEYADSLHSTPNEVIQTLRHYSAIYAATCQQSVGHSMGKAKDQPQLSFENVVVDEAARANPLDLLIPMSLGKRRIILVGDHRQLPHLLEPDVERELMQSVSDETAKALKTSLFERLFEDLRAREQRDGIRRVETLDQQFRMHPTLGQFVSDVFYEPHGEGFRSPRPASEFRHNIQAWTRAQPACAAWKNIPFAKGGDQRSGHSWQRQPEATWIAQHVRTLIDDDDARDLTIGVISFYRAQV